MKKNETFRKNLKKDLMGIAILITALAVFQNPVQAKMIHGEVVAVKDDGSSFSFKRSDPSNPSVAEQLDITVLPNTKFEKISSLKELAPGDEVVVDAAKKRESGIWEASFIKISKVQLYEGVLASKTQPK